ncbi:MAG: HIT domain-containing protein [Desulfobulbus sp.]|nr:HIT domain-containing protein [Desulfobulbus sp.]
MEHVCGSAPRYPGCLFEPPDEVTFSKQHLLLFRDELVVILLNRFPYANGHLLLAPRRHVADLTELNTAEQLRIMELLSSSSTIIRRHLCCHGINIGLNLGKAAGAGIADHLHFHLVPRWEDDHNFITVCAEIRTIPQHIETTFDLLLDDFQQLLPLSSP